MVYVDTIMKKMLGDHRDFNKDVIMKFLKIIGYYTGISLFNEYILLFKKDCIRNKCQYAAGQSLKPYGTSFLKN